MITSSKSVVTRSKHGFTLVELLVVIGLIALLAGGIGLAFGGGDKANALQGAQSTLQSLVSAVRGQAALAGKEAALFVDVNDAEAGEDQFDTEKFLRSFVIAVENEPGQWEVVGDAITLPAGIYLVPRAGGAFTKATIDNANGTYPLSLGFDGTVSTSLLYPNNGGSYQGKYALVLSLSARGTKSRPSDLNASSLVLSPAERSADKITFQQADLVRGAIISTYGVLTPINDASGF